MCSAQRCSHALVLKYFVENHEFEEVPKLQFSTNYQEFHKFQVGEVSICSTIKYSICSNFSWKKAILQCVLQTLNLWNIYFILKTHSFDEITRIRWNRSISSKSMVNHCMLHKIFCLDEINILDQHWSVICFE